MLGHTLPDILGPGLKVVFCGTAAGRVSAAKRQYYAGRGNRFWQTLEQVGFTDRQLTPDEFRKVLDYNIGLTDIAKAASGSDGEVPSSAYDAKQLRQKIERLVPRAVAFNGKNAARRYFGERAGYGRSDDIGVTALFVLPSSSGAARRYWDILYWRELAEFLAKPLS